MGVDMSDNPPTRDLFPSPALSLSLAGIFRDHHANAEAAAARRAGSTEVEEGDEGSGGGFGSSRGRTSREDTAVEISSENSGAVRSRSDDDEFNEELDENDEDGDGDGDGVGVGGNKKKKRKKYHRHTADQIREMEALFKESPHPDEKQRQQLSKQLGLHPRQVKFWFQNRRTQIKAIQERHENSLLKTEIEQLKEENKSLRDTIHKAACANCGFSTSDSSKHAGAFSTTNNINPTQQQHLKIENARLKAEVEKLKQMVGKTPPGGSPGTATTATSPTSSCPGAAAAAGTGTDQENRSSLDFYAGIFGIEKSKVTDIANSALEELKMMATAGPPLWVKSFETGREILNYDEYVKEFQVGSTSTSSTGSGGRLKRAIEASRETGVVFIDLPRLVQTFMDENQWKEMFPCLISKAATVDVISNGEGPNKDGAVQLMFAELQMLTPMVPTREVYFIRYCRQLSAEQWAIVDVSIPKVEENVDASLVKCRKKASGCIIEDKSNGHCKVTWVEHLECQKTTLHSMYRSIVNSGLAFGARHWMTTLQLQCERLVFFMATNVPTKDSNGVATLAGRKSILKLAQRMTWSFCRAIGASSYNTWAKVTSKTGDDIRVASRKNLNDPAEPIGLILTAVSSVWLPISPNVLFDFLRDHARRHEWDAVTADGGPVQSVANLAKGKDRGNAVAVQTTKSKEGSNIWFLQDSSTNAYESTVIYAPVDIPGMQSVMTGCDSSNLPILPSGFSILPDGIESSPMVISSREEERSSEGGSLLTVALQVVTPTISPTAKLTPETMESVKTLISSTLQNIKTSLQCEDG